MKNITTLLILALVGCSKPSPETETKVTTENKTASSETSKIALDFYQWYSEAINNDRRDEYQPKFVADAKGIMTVDYSKYVDNLKKFGFADELINEEVEYFEKCSANLKGIKFSERDKYMSDLDDYEEKGCDFNNVYRWTMDMEPYDGARILDEKDFGDSSIVLVQPFNIDEKTKKHSDWEKKAKVTLKKQSGSWKITNIEI